jgi:predicted RND superfamily exporter protein
MAANRSIQTSSVLLGIVIGVVLYAVTRHIFWILVGIVIGVALISYARRR